MSPLHTCKLSTLKESITSSLLAKFHLSTRTAIRLSLAAPVLGCACIAAPSMLGAQESHDQGQLAWMASESMETVSDMEALLKNRVDPNFTDSTWGTPMCAAAKADNIPKMEVLLKHGAKVDFGRQTALMCVRDLDAAQWLVSHRASVNAHTTGATEGYFYPQTPLQWAIYHGVKPELVQFLLASGATMDGTEGYNPTFLAIDAYRADLLRVLLEHGANVEAKNKNGETPLIYAETKSTKPPTEAASVLLDHGAAVDATDNYGNTALQEAVAYSHVEDVRLLLDHHADMFHGDNGGVEPFSYALYGGKMDIVQAFFDHNVDLNRKNKSGVTEIYTVASNGNLDVYTYLLNHHADALAKSDAGDTVLMAAAGSYGKGAPAIVADLLARGIDVNAQDKFGSTALMAAAGGYKPSEAYRWQNEIVKQLLEHGAKKDVANVKGKTAIDLAEGQSNCNAVALLESAPYTRTIQCLANAPEKLKIDLSVKVYAKGDGSKTNYTTMMPLVVATNSALPHPLDIPEEAHKLYVQANVTLKAAQDKQEMQSAIDLYDQAIRLCPWYADAWYNLSLALEKENDFESAKIAMSYAMGMDPQLAGNQATQERQYTLEAQQKLADQRQKRQKELDDAADHIRQIVGGHTMYRFWVFGDASFNRCTMQAESQGTCLAWDSTRYPGNVGNGHNGTSLGSIAAVTTENNKVVLSLGTQRFCIPPDSAHSLEMQASWGFSNNQVLGITDCDHPDQKLYNLNVLPAGNSYLLGGDGKTRPTDPGTVQVAVERCTDDACTTPDVSFYWYK